MSIPRPDAPWRRRSGFTLIEIMAVIAVIGILAAFLLPVYTRARQHARMTPCISNLRQIGMAVKMYMDDHNGGRPIGFQSIYDRRYFKSQAVLLCPDDPTGNWGGLQYEEKRKAQLESPNQDAPPAPPAETIRYSYLHPFTPDWPNWQWNLLMQVENGNPGIAACQLHGRKTFEQFSDWPHTILEYEGVVLQARLDGSVGKKHIYWKTERIPGEGTSTVGDSRRFFSDHLSDAMKRYFEERRRLRESEGKH